MILKLYFEEVLGYKDFLYQLKNKKEEEIIFKKVNIINNISFNFI